MLAFPGLCIYVSVHRNARMTEEIRRIFEVFPAFADNVGWFKMIIIYSGHHRMIEMTESKRSEDEVNSGISDNAGQFSKR